MPKIEELNNLKPAANPSPQTKARAEIAGNVLTLFEKYRTARDSKQELFRDRTLKQYTDDNVKRFIQFKRRPLHKKKWQSNLASSTPNEKLIGVLSKLATKGIEGKVISLEELSEQNLIRERVSNYLLKAASIKNEDDFQIILEMLEAAEKGTIIGFEHWSHGKSKIREITDQDAETGELKFNEKTIRKWNDVKGQIINLEDFYPGNLLVRPGKVQDMDDCFLRSIMSEDEFDDVFGKYQDAYKVSTIQTLGTINESTPFWKQTQDVAKDEVEVLRYFNQLTDEFVIVANGIWINPIGKATVSPLPWNHKRLPFWAAVFEPLDANFFYGRSLIDKLISMVDAKDALFDRILDQMTIAVSRPIITDNKTKAAITKGFLQPNNVIETDWSNGKPNFDVVPVPEPPASSITLYQLLQQNLEQANITAEVIGGRGPAGKTATQVNTEREGALQIVSLFLTMIEHGIKDKLRLRFPNILQFYTMPSTLDGNNESRFRKVVLKNEKLATGKVGTLQVELVPEARRDRVLGKMSQAGQEAEYIEITPEFIRDFQYEIDIVPQSSIKMTEVQRQILELNFQRVMAELYPDKFSRDAGFDELARTFGKDPSKLKVQNQSGTEMPMGGGITETAGEEAAMPTGIKPVGIPSMIPA